MQSPIFEVLEALLIYSTVIKSFHGLNILPGGGAVVVTKLVCPFKKQVCPFKKLVYPFKKLVCSFQKLLFCPEDRARSEVSEQRPQRR